VQEHYFNVDVFPVFVKEVLEEVGDGLVGDVSADHDVPILDENRSVLVHRWWWWWWDGVVAQNIFG
jgi:hypothetical protein